MKNLFSGLLKGRFAGHPIHVMLVHFPVALFPMALVLDGLSLYLHDISFAAAALYCVIGGSLLGWMALLFGVSDLLLIDPESRAMKKGLIHGSLNLTWVCVFSVFAFLGFKSYPVVTEPLLIKIIFEAIVVFGMFYSNYIGGNLIYKHKIGLEQLHEESGKNI